MRGGRVGVMGRAGRSLEQEGNARPGLYAWGWGTEARGQGTKTTSGPE